MQPSIGRTGKSDRGVANEGSSPGGYSSDDSDGVYRHTHSRARSTGMGHNIFNLPHESQEREDDTNQHSA